MTLPARWSLTKVYGQFLRTDGSADTGSIWFETAVPVYVQNDNGQMILVIPKRQEAQLDQTGYFEIMLATTDDPDINPVGWTYQVSEKIAGGRSYSIEVPHGEPEINLVVWPHAIPVPNPPPVVSYLTTMDIGQNVASQAAVVAAQAAAELAQTTADAAQATATTAAAQASTALATANAAQADAAAAQADAATALSTASDAQSTATDANATALSAATAASAASAAAATALTAANNAQSTADGKLGLHATADAAQKWSTPRVLTLSGDVAGSNSLDGSADVEISVAVNNAAHAVIADSADVWSTPRSLTLTGDASGTTLMNGSGDETITVTVSHATAADSATNATHAADAAKWATSRTLTFTGDTTGSGSIDGSGNVSIALATNHAASATSATSATVANHLANTYTLVIAGDVTGTTTFDTNTAGATFNVTGVHSAAADHADKLTTARTISLTGDVTGSHTFDGSADISIACTVSGGGGGGGSGGWKNLLYNGDMSVWQRGQSSLNVAAGSSRYLCDRWRGECSGEAFQYARAITATFLNPIPDAPDQYLQGNMTTSAAGAGNYSFVEQKIPGLRKFSGKTVTLSFWVAGNTGRPISTELIQEYGTGGSPSASVNSLCQLKTGNLTTTITKYTVTATLPAASGTYGTNGDDGLRVRFWLSAGSNFDSRTGTLGQMTSGAVVITRVQLEAGSTATTTDLRPYALELAMCQRFYEKSFDYATTPTGVAGTAQKELGLATSTTSVTTSRRFKVPKRVAPTVALWASADGNGGQPNAYVLSADGSTWTPGTTTTSQINETGFNLTIAGTSLAAGAAYLTSGQWEADAELP